MGHIFAFVLLDIAVIIVVARLFGRIARYFRQPAVVGEIVAGIALGPSLLGLISVQIGDHMRPLNEHLFPVDVVPYLKILAQLGLVLFMFIVGLELDVALIRGRERRAGTISLASIVLPFALGAAATLILHPLHDEVDGKPVTLLALMLFMGVAMSITAFPVLARILAERKMNRTTVGVLALAAAAVDDILAWTLLAFVIAVVAGDSPWAVLRIVALSALFAAVMFGVVKPQLARLLDWYKRAGRVTPDMLAIILVGILLSALITERIGIHEIFGAFLFGAIMPRKGAQEFTREILDRLEQMSVLLLLPIFFVVAGFGVNLRAFKDPGLLWQLALILAAAIVGKFVGAFVGARMQRMPVQQSAAIAVLMNTRGLTELVILLVGKQLGVLDTAMFTMMVVMALVTTAITEPLLRIVYPDKAVQRDIDATTKAALGSEQTYRALVVVDGPPGVTTDRMLRLAAAAAAGREPREILLSRFLVTEDSDLPEIGAGALPDLAGMAEAVEALEAFADRTEITTVPIRVLCRFSSDPGGDLVRQIAASGAEVVLVSEDWVRRNPEGFERLDAVVVLIVPAELPDVWLAAGTEAALALSAGKVLVRDDGSSDGTRGVLVAARAAAYGRIPLSAIISGSDGKTRRKLNYSLEPLHTSGTAFEIDSVVPTGDSIGVVARIVDRTGGSGLNLRDEIAAIVDGLDAASGSR
ncbi:cation:proton antiporter [Antrihabitans sp. YC2-6]|uniref:cation:proton antiporter domain-containing protein n=1 Tax=Antrihabitans sp. YC2-6 TaxID=2799498 RepID=UPI0027DE3540|nr:cation:proton antiporter [Antrihabitans sp. YC2-6]